MSLLNNKNTKNKATVVDGKLILSLPEAIDPVVWQMNLGDAKASALEVTTAGETSALTLKNPNNETTTIASFIDRETAIQSLMATSKALENASGQIQPAGTTVKTKSSWPKKILTAIGILATLFVLYSIIIVITGTGLPTEPTRATAPQNTGVPMSADDFLRGR